MYLKRKWDIMSYNAKADENYRKKCKTIGLKFTLNELDFYENIVKHCKNNTFSAMIEKERKRFVKYL